MYVTTVFVEDRKVATYYARRAIDRLSVVQHAALELRGAKDFEAFVRLDGEPVADLTTNNWGHVKAEVRDKRDGRVWHMMQLNGFDRLVYVYPPDVPKTAS